MRISSRICFYRKFASVLNKVTERVKGGGNKTEKCDGLMRARTIVLPVRKIKVDPLKFRNARPKMFAPVLSS